jgi:hypothetical protein
MLVAPRPGLAKITAAEGQQDGRVQGAGRPAVGVDQDRQGLR